MPSVVLKMENGAQNGSRTNHDRDPEPNGVNGTASVPALANGSTSALPQKHKSTNPNRMNDLPDEIQHITQGFVPLSVLLGRLAQTTHNQLEAKILELAKMPVPKQQQQQQLNGAATSSSLPDDDTKENLQKKRLLLHFIQEQHAKWVKALIITNWARDADAVSKLIDIKCYMDAQRRNYDSTVDNLLFVKRDLTFARLPSPDLKTGLHVLARGKAPWLPELGYLEPPPVTAQSQAQFLDNLNTQLTLRLSLDEYDKIPYHFKDYRIQDGRVTFVVKNEFEVDLTIADEDFTKQFWFIDFRFLFLPTPANFTPNMTAHMEHQVNQTLAEDGLAGCYKFLHELVLTHKIGDYRRQAIELSKQKWVGTLNVERLNRAMGIQYWVDRYHNGPKSWILLGVASNKKPGAPPNPRKTSSLMVRWFKDGREMQDAQIALEESVVSAEKLLQRVIGLHIGSILTAIHSQLRIRPRFANNECGIRLHLSRDNPAESLLSVDLGNDERLEMRIDPITGFFALSPASPIVSRSEQRLNSSKQNPVQDAITCIEYIRYCYFNEEVRRRGRAIGWAVVNQPVGQEDVKALLGGVHAQTIWLQRAGWGGIWFVVLALGVNRDKWYLVKLSEKKLAPKVDQPAQSRYTIEAQMPMNTNDHKPMLDDSLFTKLTLMGSAIITNRRIMMSLHEKRIRYTSVKSTQLLPGIKVPSIMVKVSELLRHGKASGPFPLRNRRPWIKDWVELQFTNVEATKKGTSPSSGRLRSVVKATLQVIDKSRFSLLKGTMGRDVLFNKQTGAFHLTLYQDVDTTVHEELASRIQAIERLVDLIVALRCTKVIQVETVTLRRVTFTYSDPVPAGTEPKPDAKRWRATLDLNSPTNIQIILEQGSPHQRCSALLTAMMNGQSNDSKSVLSLLPLTLSLNRALDDIRASWTPIAMANRGMLNALPRNPSWYLLKYRFPAPGVKGPPGSGARWFDLGLDIKLRPRNSEMLWYVSRDSSATPQHQQQQKKPDHLNAVLEAVFDGAASAGFKRFGNSAAAGPEGIENLMKIIDEGIRKQVIPGAGGTMGAAATAVLSSPVLQQSNKVATAPMGLGSMMGRPTGQQNAKSQQRSGIPGRNPNVVVID